MGQVIIGYDRVTGGRFLSQGGSTGGSFTHQTKWIRRRGGSSSVLKKIVEKQGFS